MGQRQHGRKSIFVCVSTLHDEHMSRLRQSLPLLLMRKKPTKFVDHLGNRVKVEYSVSVVSEDFLMFFGVLGKHASADCRNFKRSHAVPIPVSAPDQTECNPAARDCFTKMSNPDLTARYLSRRRKAIP